MSVFFNDTTTTEIYTLALHDALPISTRSTPRSSRRSTRPDSTAAAGRRSSARGSGATRASSRADRKSTRLNSSHAHISYGVFCLKKNQRLAQCNALQTDLALHHLFQG